MPHKFVPRPPFARVRIVDRGSAQVSLALALALRARAAAREVELLTTDAELLARAREHGLAAAPRASLLPSPPAAIFLAGPPSALEAWIADAPTAVGLLVIGLASVMRPLLAVAARAHRRNPGLRLIGAHPFLEVHGSQPAEKQDPVDPADLFAGRAVALCSLAEPVSASPESAAPDTAALDSAAHLWRLLGAVPVFLPAAEHDRAAALTSHLPFVTASALSALAAERVVPDTRAEMVLGPEFLGPTRAALEPAGPWSEILVRNADAVVPLLRALAGSLEETASSLARCAPASEAPPRAGGAPDGEAAKEREAAEGGLRARLEAAAQFRRRHAAQ